MSCILCKKRGKTWSGGDPICFLDGKFEDNWNCATLNAIRDLFYQPWEGKPQKVGIHVEFLEDQTYATIRTDDLNIDAYCLWTTWYKRRGCTEQMWLMTWEGPRNPTEDELLKIITKYKPEAIYGEAP